MSLDAAAPEDLLPASLRMPFLVRVLRSLVRTESFNPGAAESAMARRVVEWLEPTSARVEVVESMPGRPSVAAVLAGAPGPAIVLNGHMDTVPVDDRSSWTVDPFAGEERSGLLYGRGACDMKAGLAVQIAIAHLVAARRKALRGSLVLHFAAGEERAEPGTLSLIERGYVGDVGITTEPTGLAVATAARGAAFFDLTIKGRSGHAGRPALAVNPIERVPGALRAVGEYARGLAGRRHALLGTGSCTPTLVAAGVKENAIPDRCTITMDRRLLPGERIDDELAELERHLSRALGDDEHATYELSCRPRHFAAAEIDAESPFAAAVRDAATDVTGTDRPIAGTPYASDVRNLVNDAGMEAVTFGPGSIDLAHAPDEHVPIVEVQQAARVIARVVEELILPTA